MISTSISNKPDFSLVTLMRPRNSKIKESLTTGIDLDLDLELFLINWTQLSTFRAMKFLVLVSASLFTKVAVSLSVVKNYFRYLRRPKNH